MTDRIEKHTEIKASVDRVWKALTDYQEFGEWFGVKLDGPFIVGESSTGHMTVPGYEHLKWESVIQAMEPKTFFSYTWHPYAIDSNVDYSQEPSTLVEFRLEETTTGTLLTVTESGFDKIPPHRRDEALRMNDRGWAIQMQDIEEHIMQNA